jgi:hypothetical protein
MSRTALALSVLAALTLFSVPTSAADYYRRTARHHNRASKFNHMRYHDDLDHRAFHRELLHRKAHRYPMTYRAHERLHDHLDHDAYHDRLQHRKAHRSHLHAPRHRYYGHRYYGYGSGVGFKSHGITFWFGL